MTANTTWRLYPLSKDPVFDFSLLHVLSTSVYDGADVGEVLLAASNIVPGDFESFTSAFQRLASRVYDRALAVVRSGFPFSARTAFFSAATYFRFADFFLHGNPSDARITSLWNQQMAAFDQALALLKPPGQRLTIKTPDFDIPAIWMTPSEEPRQRPTIILGNGYDGSQEDMYHLVGLAALERGFNVMSYEGPGQPSVLRGQKLSFIPDWERVVGPVMDHVLRQTGHVDAASVDLLGVSFGGYLAPRAAAFDDRFAAVIALDGVWDFGAVLGDSLGPEMMRLHAAGARARFDALARARFLQPGQPTGLRWGLEQGMWAFGARSPFDLVTLATNYTLEHVVDRIRAPVFVGDAEHGLFFGGQPTRLAAALGQRAHLHHFRSEDAVGEHTGLGGLKLQNQVVLDWFQQVLADRGHNGTSPPHV